MPIVSTRRALPSRAVLIGLTFPLVGGIWAGCKKREPGPTASPSAAAPATASIGAALPAPEEMTRCRRRPDFSLTLEADAPASKPLLDAEEDEDDDALMPFGVDIGAALATPYGAAAAGIRGAGQAFVALLGERASRRVDLGEIHGDAETPSLALVGERLLVALRSSDASGFTIKLGSIAGPESNSVEWGYELTKLGREVTGVQLAAAGERGVLVYQGAQKGDPRLVLGTFAAAKLAEPFEVKALPVKDAEMPRLLARPGGYWLSWVRSLPEPKKPAKAGDATGSAARDPEEAELLDVGLRVLEVSKLDEQGKLQGTPLRVGEPRRQVLLYDIAGLPDGRLLVAARSDSAAPGAEGGALLLSEVGADGSVHEDRLEDDEIGAGVPALLVDADAKSPGPWLAVSAPNDATRLGLVQGTRTSLRADPLLGNAQVLAVTGGHWLLQRARGRGVAIEALDCSLSVDAAPEKKP